MIARVLAVEDNTDELLEIHDSLSVESGTLANKTPAVVAAAERFRYALQTLGIERIVLHEAESASTGRQYLDRVRDEGEIYSVLFLDLSLPEVDKGGNDRRERGLDLLRKAVCEGTVRQVLVVSSFGEYEWVRAAFAGGAVDFIHKPAGVSVLRQAFLDVWNREMESQAGQLMGERAIHLGAVMETALRYRFGGCLSPLILGVDRAVEGLLQAFQHQFAIDLRRDGNKLIQEQLDKHAETIQSAREAWGGLRDALPGLDGEPGTAILQDIVAAALALLQPCFVHYRIATSGTPTGQHDIQVFGEDVATVVRELLMGAIESAKRDYPTRLKNDRDGWGPHATLVLSTEVRPAENAVNLVLVDDLPVLDAGEADAINRGEVFPVGERHSRAWGLSVVQQLARHGAGHLTIGCDEHGRNHIVYRLPVPVPRDK